MQEVMKRYLFLTFLSLLGASSAAPAGIPRQDDGGIGQFIFPVWPITNLHRGCSLGGCIGK